MPRRVIDVAHLREVTQQSRARLDEEIERRNAIAREKQEKQALKLGRSICKRWKDTLPGLLEKASQEGINSVTIGESIITLAEKKAAEMFIKFCERNGLQVKIVRAMSMGDSWDNRLVVSW